MNTTHPARLPALLAAAALALSGCKYSFHNPTEELTAGEIGGVVRAGSGPGVAASVRGSLLDQAVRPSGRLELVPLPPGTHTLLLRQGVAYADLRQVDLGYGSDGKVEGVWLGALDLPQAVTLSGAFYGADSAVSTEGVAVDEATGMALPTSNGEFKLEAVAVGAHRILAFSRSDATGATWIGGPVQVTAALSEQGTEKALIPFPLRATTAGVGHLYFRVASMVAGLAPSAAVVRVTDWDGAPVAVPAADSNGDRDLALTEGAYFVEVLPPPAFAATVSGPERRVAVVVADDDYDLGTFTLAEDAALDASARSCHADADCAPGACLAGVCTGYTPAAVAPADVPLCDDLPRCFTVPDACGWPGGLGGAATSAYCVQNPAVSYGVCLPCSTRCTLDGVTVVTAPACSY